MDNPPKDIGMWEGESEQKFIGSRRWKQECYSYITSAPSIAISSLSYWPGKQFIYTRKKREVSGSLTHLANGQVGLKMGRLKMR